MKLLINTPYLYVYNQKALYGSNKKVFIHFRTRGELSIFGFSIGYYYGFVSISVSWKYRESW